ncbi:MAG: hypothetical protein QW165_04400 [Candidatus Woesearchaeota archaeon]
MDVGTIIQFIYTKVAIVLLILLTGFIIAKVAGKIIRRVLAGAELNKILAKAHFAPMSDSIAAIAEYAIYIATFGVLLHQFGLAHIVLWVIGVVAAFVIIFSLTLTVRDFIPNAIIGLLIRKKLKAKLGKKVRIGMISGKLEHIGIVGSTVIEKEEHHVPHLYASKYI